MNRESHRRLKADLIAVVGEAAVISDPRRLLVYECDAFTLERKLPELAVLPAGADEVKAVVDICRRHETSVVPRGAGTSLSGSTLAVSGGVMIGLSRMNRILRLDAANRRALVEAGCVNAWITREARAQGLYYAPDPSSQSACTIGGNVATNSGGPHTLKQGVTANHVLGLELVTLDGNRHWLGVEPEGGEPVGGYDLRGVVIGSEGMFGVVTQVLVRLLPLPEACRTFLAVFETVADASRAVSAMICAGIVPGALEMMDRLIVQAVEAAWRFGFPCDAGAVLIVELDGSETSVQEQAERALAICAAHGSRETRTARNESERERLWRCRKRAFGAIGRLSPNFMTQDGVVPRSKLPEIMEFIAAVGRRYELRIPNVFHAGDGNIHPLILYDERDPEQVRRAVAAGHDILERCLALGGSVSGEHGIGVEKIALMARQFSPADLEAMKRLRAVFDPEGRCNPGKMFPGGGGCAELTFRKQIAV